MKFFPASSFLLLSALFAVSCANLDDTVTSRFQVEIPKDLYRMEGYNHREALFGSIPYGHEISQMVYYADSDLCGEVDTHKGYPCTLEGDKCKAWETPFILMVDRNTCTFVEKVRKAQIAGAAAVLIADNICTCDSLNTGKCTNNAGTSGCEGVEPIMADDGSGGDITIPAFLLFKEDADALKSVVVDQNGLVQVKMTWDTPAPDDRVEWEFWHSLTEATTKHFQSVFKSEARGLGTHAFFTPHFAIWSRSQCIGNNNMCDGLCTNGGRYCADDPDGLGTITGADVVVESLRRICIWNTHGTDGIGEKWWAYVNAFQASCDDEKFPERFPSLQDSSCANAAMAKVGITKSTIDSCMTQSGGWVNAGPNVLLDKEISALQTSGIFAFPAVTINTKLMFGNIDNKNVFNAICAGFLDGTQPEVCDKCESCASSEMEYCTTTMVCSGGPVPDGGGSSKGGVSTGTLVFSLLFTMGIMGGAGFVYWKRQQAEMRDQVRGILAEYMPLDDDGTQITSKNGGTTI